MKRLYQGAASAAGLLIALAVAGCSPPADLGPPAVAYGQTECDLCRMIISDEQFAAGAVVQTADGVKKLAFDDLGCLLNFLREQPGGSVTCYVHDYETRAWLDAGRAVFLRSAALQTPMASNLAACQAQSAAETLRRRFPGDTMTFEQLRQPAENLPGSERK